MIPLGMHLLRRLRLLGPIDLNHPHFALTVPYHHMSIGMYYSIPRVTSLSPLTQLEYPYPPLAAVDPQSTYILRGSRRGRRTLDPLVVKFELLALGIGRSR